MISLPIGAVLTLAVFVISMGVSNLGLYLNFHSVLLVGGGTLTILLFSAPMSVLLDLQRQCFLLFKKVPSFSEVQGELLQLGKNRNAEVSTDEELIAYAKDLWAQGISHELFIVLISQKRKELEQKTVVAIQTLKNLAKYPPALGMAGTVMGIVTLFQTLGSDKEKIGPALAMALTATFFGLAIANCIVMPLSDRLQVRHLHHQHYLHNIYQVLLLINQDESEQLIEEEVRLRATG